MGRRRVVDHELRDRQVEVALGLFEQPALGKGAVLVTMGALFILLGSALIGIIQVLVYVGGILTLFIFAVMFVTGDEEEVAS